MTTPTPQNSLRNTLLIAMPQMADPNFAGAVIYICEHNPEGTMGLVINHPLNMGMKELLDEIGIDGDDFDPTEHIFLGGPVDIQHGFVLHTFSKQPDPQTSLIITRDIALTSSREVLASIANGDEPRQRLVTLGYAGWGPGQLEHEIAENIWLNSPANKTILFSTPFDQRLGKAADTLGIDLALLSHEAGHA